MAAEHSDRFVQPPSELADFSRVLLHGLLLPAVRNRPEQRDQRRGTRRNDPLVDAELDERRILFERRAEEHFSWQEHDHEVGAHRHLLEVALARELRDVRPDLTGVLDEQALPRLLVWRIQRTEICIERHFRIDDDVLAAGELDNDIGTDPSVVPSDGLLLGEVTVLHHPGELDHPLQLQLAPAATNARTLQRIHQPRGLRVEVLSHQIERRDFLDQLRAGFDATALRLLDFAIHLLEGLRHGCEQILDGLLPSVDVGCCLGARFAHSCFHPALPG